MIPPPMMTIFARVLTGPSGRSEGGGRTVSALGTPPAGARGGSTGWLAQKESSVGNSGGRGVKAMS